MEKKLKTGTKLSSVVTASGYHYIVNKTVTLITKPPGRRQVPGLIVESIRIVDVAGQCTYVPWAEISFLCYPDENIQPLLINLAFCEKACEL